MFYSSKQFTLKQEGTPIDIYRTKIGIRTLRWDNTTFLINDKPVYLRGFGKHEDSDVSQSLSFFVGTRNKDLAKYNRYEAKVWTMPYLPKILICYDGLVPIATELHIIPIQRNQCSLLTNMES